MKKVVIRPTRFTPISFSELYEYRELFWSLAYRDFKVRYAQTVLGILWALIQPLASILILNLVFGKFAGVETGAIPHILFTTAGMACWTYFSFVLSNSGNSLVTSQQMIKKIYFPRIIVPVSKAVVGLIDLAMVFLVLVGLMIYFDTPVSTNVIFLPFFVVFNLLSALGVGIWISALTVRYRDFKYVVPFLVQIGLYVSPVAFPTEVVQSHLPEWAVNLYFLNPVVGIIEGFRWSLFEEIAFANQTIYSFVSGTVVLISGLIFFLRVERKIADIV